ncbi:helix-turn-helix domain-containing protein [Phenylobacterium sp.]|jgi:AcrR family transcriptional regulator|uniref:TetR/AcrR family transcriptional regulator n=1 Tax=Phenylobacterium sp. TaxID=1871053 RepID=UPI002F941C03
MATPRPPKPDDPPRGRDAVRAAVLAAAEQLFAERGYAAVSVRDLAQAAGVNHGLIHRHFGSKEAVLHAVLQGMFSDVAAAAASRIQPGDPDFLVQVYPLVTSRKRHWQILMRAVLDGFDFRAAGFQFPITAGMMAHTAARTGADDEEARVLAGLLVSGGLGWLLLETYLTPVLGLEHVPTEELRQRMAERVGRVLP